MIDIYLIMSGYQLFSNTYIQVGKNLTLNKLNLIYAKR